MKITVIGAGTMGSGIAQAFAQADGFEVMLCSSSRESAARGKTKIEKGLRGRVLKGKITEERANEILNKINVAIPEDCAGSDLVIEAVPEQMDLKKHAFRQMEEICGNDCIFASNTSSLSITELGRGAGRPVVGMHFFNPAPVMKLVEVIPGLDTPVEVTEKIEQIATVLGKTPVRVQESAGFVVNRILIPMINEAVGLLAEGISTAEGIDTAMKLGANHPMGPLALGDLIGLDVCLAIMETLQAETGDPKYRPHPLLKKMVRANRLGVKTGRGFFTYG